MNLLSNAFKFAPAGGVVRCTLQTTNRALLICVEDSGPGVQPEHRTAIFERFRQVDGGANRQVSGTGLGLAIAHEFVEMHRGTIEVGESALGGARFVVRLPLRSAIAAADAHAAGAGAGARPEHARRAHRGAARARAPRRVASEPRCVPTQAPPSHAARFWSSKTTPT